MSLWLCGQLGAGELAQWQQALQSALPEETIHIERVLPAALRGTIDVAVVANPTPGSLGDLPGLALIQSLWAGVDRLLADSTLPAGVPLARMVDPAMNLAMAETALWAVLSLQRDFFRYARQQRRTQWREWPQRRADEFRIGVLGQGQMGSSVSSALAAQGYPVQGWRRTLQSGAGDLPDLLQRSDVLINLLPLTPATRGLLDAELFAQLPAGAAVVNLARGAHLVEADLLAALDSGHLAHAVLDVFETEPLPAGHPFWQHPAVTVLPHAAAQTDLRSAAAVVADNVQRLRSGRPLLHRVDLALGY